MSISPLPLARHRLHLERRWLLNRLRRLRLLDELNRRLRRLARNGQPREINSHPLAADVPISVRS